MTISDGEKLTRDFVIIGGGFYGCAIACHLAKKHPDCSISILEKEAALLKRASYNNQARIHNGYHYPRSFVTAYRSKKNYPRFLSDWPDAIENSFTKLYAIPKRQSKVTAAQFFRFCSAIGAEIDTAEPEETSLFNANMIDRVYRVQECAFNADILAQLVSIDIKALGVDLHLATTVKSISSNAPNTQIVRAEKVTGSPLAIEARHIFNCTYSGLNQISGYTISSGLKHEMTEMALVDTPPALKNIGVTVMDGPFFSLMPFPAESLHTLSHVRYTPHKSWVDSIDKDPYEEIENYSKQSRYNRMVRDAGRYLPLIRDSIYRKSLFEVKTVLTKNEVDDGRPILFEASDNYPSVVSILGSKIDNVYDVLERVDEYIEH